MDLKTSPYIRLLIWLSACGAFPHVFWGLFDRGWLPLTFDPAPLVPVVFQPQTTLLSPRDDMASSVGAFVMALLVAWIASILIGLSGVACALSKRDRALLWLFQLLTVIAGIRSGAWGWYLFLISRALFVDIRIVAGNTLAPILLPAPYVCQAAAFIALGVCLHLRPRTEPSADT